MLDRWRSNSGISSVRKGDLTRDPIDRSFWQIICCLSEGREIIYCLHDCEIGSVVVSLFHSAARYPLPCGKVSEHSGDIQPASIDMAEEAPSFHCCQNTVCFAVAHDVPVELLQCKTGRIGSIGGDLVYNVNERE